MKKLALSKVPAPLAEYMENLEEEPVVLTANGRPVAAIVALPNTDAESVALATNPRFLALLKRSRRRQQTEGGLSPAEVRRRLGLKKKRASRRS